MELPFFSDRKTVRADQLEQDLALVDKIKHYTHTYIADPIYKNSIMNKLTVGKKGLSNDMRGLMQNDLLIFEMFDEMRAQDCIRISDVGEMLKGANARFRDPSDYRHIRSHACGTNNLAHSHFRGVPGEHCRFNALVFRHVLIGCNSINGKQEAWLQFEKTPLTLHPKHIVGHLWDNAGYLVNGFKERKLDIGCQKQKGPNGESVHTDQNPLYFTAPGELPPVVTPPSVRDTVRKDERSAVDRYAKRPALNPSGIGV